MYTRAVRDTRRGKTIKSGNSLGSHEPSIPATDIHSYGWLSRLARRPASLPFPLEGLASKNSFQLLLWPLGLM